MYYQPLVSEKDYQRYKSYEDRIKAKEAQIEAALEIAAAEYKDRRLHSRLADYMMAARKVRLEGSALEKVSRRQDLDAEVLKKWVNYLRPDFRPFLQRWYRRTLQPMRPRSEHCRGVPEKLPGERPKAP